MNIQLHRDISQRMIPLVNNSKPLLMTLKSRTDSVKLNRNGDTKSVEAEKARLKNVAEGFEAIFIRQLLRTMRSTIPNGGMFGEGTVGEIYGDMMDEAFADIISKRSIFGLAETLYRQLVKEIEPNTKEHYTSLRRENISLRNK